MVRRACWSCGTQGTCVPPGQARLARGTQTWPLCEQRAKKLFSYPPGSPQAAPGSKETPARMRQTPDDSHDAVATYPLQLLQLKTPLEAPEAPAHSRSLSPVAPGSSLSARHPQSSWWWHRRQCTRNPGSLHPEPCAPGVAGGATGEGRDVSHSRFKSRLSCLQSVQGWCVAISLDRHSRLRCVLWCPPPASVSLLVRSRPRKGFHLTLFFINQMSRVKQIITTAGSERLTASVVVTVNDNQQVRKHAAALSRETGKIPEMRRNRITQVHSVGSTSPPVADKLQHCTQNFRVLPLIHSLIQPRMNKPDRCKGS